MTPILGAPTCLKEGLKETSKDETLQRVKQYVMNGWPGHRGDVENDVKQYYNMKEEISI